MVFTVLEVLDSTPEETKVVNFSQLQVLQIPLPYVTI